MKHEATGFGSLDDRSHPQVNDFLAKGDRSNRLFPWPPPLLRDSSTLTAFDVYTMDPCDTIPFVQFYRVFKLLEVAIKIYGLRIGEMNMTLCMTLVADRQYLKYCKEKHNRPTA